MGNRMWGRNYHFTFAWVFLINGLVYVVWNLVTGHFRHEMVTRRDELTLRHLRAVLGGHLRRPRRERASATSYGTLQKISYGLLIFGFVPLMVLTGIAQSPASPRRGPGCSTCSAADSRRARCIPSVPCCLCSSWWCTSSRCWPPAPSTGSGR